MAFSSCFSHPQLSLKMGLVKASNSSFHNRKSPRPCLATESRQGGGTRTELSHAYSFLRGSRSIIQPELGRTVLYKKSSRVYSSLLPASQIASTAFTWGTAAVLPFYTLMLVAPRAVLTRRSMDSSIPYIALGLLYAYLLYLSWTPESLQYIFATKYWMPELSGMAKMFSNEMSLASAWIHLLAVDLFAARQVYRDGLQNNIETRHSVSLCLFICPVGVLTHLITKALTSRSRRNKEQIH